MRIFGIGDLQCLLPGCRNGAKNIADDANGVGIVLRINDRQHRIHGNERRRRRALRPATSSPVAALTRRTAEKIVLNFDNDGFVAHRGNVGAACRTRSKNGRHLINTGGRHCGLVIEEDAAEMFAVGKNVRLQRQKRAARIDEVKRTAGCSAARSPELEGASSRSSGSSFSPLTVASLATIIARGP